MSPRKPAEPIPAPTAWSYVRFSSKRQEQGDSVRRQSALAAKYAAEQGLRLDTRSYEDLGISGHRGDNLKEGRGLGLFLEAVETGKIPAGSFLLVEGLDRIGRTKPRKIIKTIERIIEAGINLVTTSDGRLYNEEVLDNDQLALFTILIVAQRAFEESDTKSKRIKASWDTRRNLAATDGTPIGGRTPGWLRHDKATNTYEVIEEKADVVRRIFAMASEGWGSVRIAKQLHQEKIPTMQGKGVWRHTAVRHILLSPTVIGTFTPSRQDHDKDGKRIITKLDPIPGYYPAIISKDLWQEIQENSTNPLHDHNKHPSRGKSNPRNPFAGLTICKRCGSRVSLSIKNVVRGVPYTYLVCTKARLGGCTYTAVRFENFEAGFLRSAEAILAGRPSRDTELLKELENLEGSQWALQDRIETLEKAYKRVTSKSILEDLVAARGQLAVLQEREKALRATAADAETPVVLKRTEALREALASKPRDIQAINTAMRALFQGIIIDPDSGQATVVWRGGGEASFVYGMPLDEAREAQKAKHRAQLSKNARARHVAAVRRRKAAAGK